jgi:alkylation response protein AidB-like acyl-CoA dehydrogenase
MAEFLLNAAQADLAASIREMVEQYIMPHALDMDIRGDDSFDWSFVKLLSEHNLLAPNIPVELGGRGLDFLSTAVLIEEIARGCAGLAACIVGEMHATIPIILGGSKKRIVADFTEIFTAKALPMENILGKAFLYERLPDKIGSE